MKKSNFFKFRIRNYCAFDRTTIVLEDVETMELITITCYNNLSKTIASLYEDRREFTLNFLYKILMRGV